MNTSSPSCSVQIEFSFPAVPLAQLRNDGSCSIVCQLDWGSGDPGLHLISVRKQPALHLLKSNSHGGLNPSSPYLPLPPPICHCHPGPGSPLLSWSDFIDQTSGMLLRKNKVYVFLGGKQPLCQAFKFDNSLIAEAPLKYGGGCWEEYLGCSQYPWKAPWS